MVRKVPISEHPNIRSEDACYKSSSIAVELSEKIQYKTSRISFSTEKELGVI